MKISKQFIRATISSVFCALIDLLIFYLICRNRTSLSIIMTATIVARIISSIINFIINKYWAFDNEKGRTKKEIIGFYILFSFKLLFSALLVWLFSFVSLNQSIIKMIIDVLLFFISYIIQDKFIFLTTDEIIKKRVKKNK